jgi:hypothetical protein
MNMDKLYEIMGVPDSIFKFSIDTGFFRLMYTPPFGASDNIYIFINDRDSLVQGINDGT